MRRVVALESCWRFHGKFGVCLSAPQWLPRQLSPAQLQWCFVSVIVQQLGACIAYVDIIGDVLRPIACKMHLGFLQNV